MRKSIFVGLVVVGVLAISSFVWSSSSFMELVAKFAGTEVANKLENSGQLNIALSPEKNELLGAGAHSKSTKQAVCTSMTSNTLIPVAVLNPEGAAATFDKVIIRTAPGLQGTVNYSLTTSTIATASSTYESIANITNSFVLSANNQWFTTSTFTNVNDRTWGAGEYLIFKTTAATTTLSGEVCAEYYNR